jgi:hypothetical protein
VAEKSSWAASPYQEARSENSFAIQPVIEKQNHTAIMVGEGSFGGQKRSSLCRQIGSLPQESIGDDELVVSVAGMGSGTIDHSPQKPAAVQRRDRSQLVMAGTTDVAEAGWVLHIAGGTQREISPAGRRALLCRTSKNWSS